MKSKRHTLEQSLALFWQRVKKTEFCWLYTGGKNEYGYGMISLAGRKNLRAHRLSYELANGQIPKGLLVLHRCDMPACVRPSHLFLGTDADNRTDCQLKGRDKTATLNADQVRGIRGLLATKGQSEISRELGVSLSVIHKLSKGMTYRWVSARSGGRSEPREERGK